MKQPFTAEEAEWVQISLSANAGTQASVQQVEEQQLAVPVQHSGRVNGSGVAGPGWNPAEGCLPDQILNCLSGTQAG